MRYDLRKQKDDNRLQLTREDNQQNKSMEENFDFELHFVTILFFTYVGYSNVVCINYNTEKS